MTALPRRVDARATWRRSRALGEAKADWLKEDLKIPTKTSFNGVAIFSFPVDKASVRQTQTGNNAHSALRPANAGGDEHAYTGSLTVSLSRRAYGSFAKNFFV